MVSCVCLLSPTCAYNIICSHGLLCVLGVSCLPGLLVFYVSLLRVALVSYVLISHLVSYVCLWSTRYGLLWSSMAIWSSTVSCVLSGLLRSPVCLYLYGYVVCHALSDSPQYVYLCGLLCIGSVWHFMCTLIFSYAMEIPTSKKPLSHAALIVIVYIKSQLLFM